MIFLQDQLYLLNTPKNMFNLDEEKIEFALGNRALVFWQGKKAENDFLRDSRYFFVSGYCYCQIQTTRLIIIFQYK